MAQPDSEKHTIRQTNRKGHRFYSRTGTLCGKGMAQWTPGGH